MTEKIRGILNYDTQDGYCTLHAVKEDGCSHLLGNKIMKHGFLAEVEFTREQVKFYLEHGLPGVKLTFRVAGCFRP